MAADVPGRRGVLFYSASDATHDADGEAQVKVRLDITLDIDPDGWALEYGLEGASRAEIARDIRDAMAAAVKDHPVIYANTLGTNYYATVARA